MLVELSPLEYTDRFGSHLLVQVSTLHTGALAMKTGALSPQMCGLSNVGSYDHSVTGGTSGLRVP